MLFEMKSSPSIQQWNDQRGDGAKHSHLSTLNYCLHLSLPQSWGSDRSGDGERGFALSTEFTRQLQKATGGPDFPGGSEAEQNNTHTIFFLSSQKPLLYFHGDSSCGVWHIQYTSYPPNYSTLGTRLCKIWSEEMKKFSEENKSDWGEFSLSWGVLFFHLGVEDKRGSESPRSEDRNIHAKDQMSSPLP